MIPYDPSLFALERAASLTAALGELVLGTSKLGGTVNAWVDIPAATFACEESYDPNDEGVLIYGTETASVSLSYWDPPAKPPLYPLDRVRATYDGEIVFLGTVDRTEITRAVDGEAVHHGADLRYDFSASLVGLYATAMIAKKVCYVYIPVQAPIDRISRWINVENWD